MGGYERDPTFPPPVPPTFKARNGIWIENYFTYRVQFYLPTGVEPAMRADLFFDQKARMQGKPDIWGKYRHDWIGHIWSPDDQPVVEHCWYFMCRERAELFRKEYAELLAEAAFF